ncbi:Erp family outer-surface lipoprotein [Borreliella burgdorferi]|uniref:Erp family outer-surface lipoprotein n=1 Tax=Borreliella burgdorferi TaxID=139 RepID=UPI000D044220|nr:Erp family outer-surface lipoprotein [Borreliella burgdorferi]MCD2413819.1 Erp family outer-surface lipoprotein [Borreliella burgdorferi]PRR14787.1 regulator [Borreliella burgdorferi]PRR18368.1 regulator [Borreliella burgdorferi]PRR22198.1 regulator [Borreliella burgdorferi]PRR52814.1 regulator [Borreliella burgdorferi]
MNKKMKMFIVYAVFILIGACKIHTSYDEQSSGEPKVKKIEFSKFTVKIKNKDKSGNWTDLGDLVVRKEENGIDTGLNAGGHSATFFSLEEEVVNNFVKVMTEGGSFKTSLYYGYKEEQSVINGIQNKEIITKIEKIDGTEYITFSGDKIKNSGDKVAEYAISLEELKKNLK